ncbi:uncharacterized protein PSFLO_07198 [Pseudozyma flocculosa]|uniref:Uncharacterized protein n=1 Tax=Pseudozyma flocculosa TaxID=84751 RepID=A0A5C3FC49_9BASI|nr:uncharacterized protein PSFLO_07198 [Pseudozyma flocculosa]
MQGGRRPRKLDAGKTYAYGEGGRLEGDEARKKSPWVGKACLASGQQSESRAPKLCVSRQFPLDPDACPRACLQPEPRKIQRRQKCVSRNASSDAPPSQPLHTHELEPGPVAQPSALLPVLYATWRRPPLRIIDRTPFALERRLPAMPPASQPAASAEVTRGRPGRPPSLACLFLRMLTPARPPAVLAGRPTKGRAALGPGAGQVVGRSCCRGCTQPAAWSNLADSPSLRRRPGSRGAAALRPCLACVGLASWAEVPWWASLPAWSDTYGGRPPAPCFASVAHQPARSTGQQQRRVHACVRMAAARLGRPACLPHLLCHHTDMLRTALLDDLARGTRPPPPSTLVRLDPPRHRGSDRGSYAFGLRHHRVAAPSSGFGRLYSAASLFIIALGVLHHARAHTSPSTVQRLVWPQIPCRLLDSSRSLPSSASARQSLSLRRPDRTTTVALPSGRHPLTDTVDVANVSASAVLAYSSSSWRLRHRRIRYAASVPTMFALSKPSSWYDFAAMPQHAANASGRRHRRAVNPSSAAVTIDLAIQCLLPRAALHKLGAASRRRLQRKPRQDDVTSVEPTHGSTYGCDPSVAPDDAARVRAQTCPTALRQQGRAWHAFDYAG